MKGTEITKVCPLKIYRCIKKGNVKQVKCIYFFIDNWLVTFDGPIMNLPQIASFGVWAANSLPYEIMMALEPCAKAL
jgi:hypothetical protein